MLAMAVEPGFDANKFRGVERGPGAKPCCHRHLRAGIDVQGRDTGRGSRERHGHAVGPVHPSAGDPGRRPRHPRRGARGTETMTVSQILFQSSNVGVITLALGLGKDRLASWIDRFGFGHRTGIDFPGETPGHRPSARALVGLDHRERPDRPGHRGDADADGHRLRDDREPRRRGAAASHRADRGRGRARKPSAAASSLRRQRKS